jgi:adenine-specific DNA-methyltransferase
MPKKNRPHAKPTAVESIRHKDSRKNIPTEELRDFVREDEERPRTMLYPRDPSLDPQLVWKGKDEQDQKPLDVPVLPIYIQEKIHPQAIIEDLRGRQVRKPADQQLDLFADFNGIDTFEKKVDFYHHDAHWSNRMILGDSLAVMTSLAEKEGLKGQVQTIYLDPPYGIRFGSNWQVSTRKRDVTDGKVADATRQPEQVQAFRDTWEYGIHSYLPYLRDRLVVARELLTESGSVFVQIGDENVHLVRSILDEVFGPECRVVDLVVKKKGSQKSGLIDPVNDYILWYSKAQRESGAIKYRPLFVRREIDSETLSEFRRIEFSNGAIGDIATVPTANGPSIDYRLSPLRLAADFPTARVFRPWPITNGGTRANQMDPIVFRGTPFPPPIGRCWSFRSRCLEGERISPMVRLRMADRLYASGKSLDGIRYLGDFPFKTLSNWWDGLGGASNPVYVVQTNPEVIARCLLMTTDPGDLVLDPTCGSGTTAFVAEQWGRRWITIDTSRVALALARTRLIAGRFPYYLLADSKEGATREHEISGQTPPSYRTDGDIKKGFVYKRVPHLTLQSIANNEEIDVIHAKWGAKLEPLRSEINKAVRQKFEEWEIPREAESGWPASIKKKLAEWWDLRRARQKEIDAAIAKTADDEVLYDQPYEDNKRVRVTGPFTVESLSPHRRLTVQAKIDVREKGVAGWSVRNVGPDKFGNMIIENLRKAGVQNRDKKERLKFDRLEPYAGEWIHAAGEFTDKAGATKRVAVCIGPEHGTVGPQLVKEAAKEAVKGVGFDLLYICGFAFDPHVDEETSRYGKLNVQICRMNPDLSMGDELLKKTGAGNLFMVFGEPDISIKKTREKGADGEKVVVEIKGVDVYDPTTGQIRSNSTDDIACWFIDTNYDGESFFVRHAYFTGADQPYEKLKRALRAEIDEAAWSALYSTKSQPFPVPETGRIAVKVINHYGDEVLKVYTVG